VCAQNLQYIHPPHHLPTPCGTNPPNRTCSVSYSSILLIFLFGLSDIGSSANFAHASLGWKS
jgi:hypothetical protein